MSERLLKYAAKLHHVVSGSHVVKNRVAQKWVDKEPKPAVAMTGSIEDLKQDKNMTKMLDALIDKAYETGTVFKEAEVFIVPDANDVTGTVQLILQPK